MNVWIKFVPVALVLLSVTATKAQEKTTYLHGQCNPGTLFRWFGSLSDTGGPDLSSPLVTDRPDFTEASVTVGRGVAQLEFGYTFLTDDDGTTRTKDHSWGEPLLRYGILRDWLELRLGVFPATVNEATGGQEDSTSGISDMYLGLKIALTPQSGILPEMAIIPQTFVPTGSDAFSSDEMLPGLNWIYAWELCDWISTAGSTQFNRRKRDDEAYTRWAQSWTISYSLADRVGAFTEWFGLFPHSADNVKPEHYFNGGFTFLLNDDVQWDIRVGVGANDAAADLFAGTGLSLRFR